MAVSPSSQEVVRKTLFIVFIAGLLTWIVVYSGTSYTSPVDVFAYCVVYSSWITVCLPWLVQNMTGQILVLIAGVVVRLFAVDVGVLAWSAFRGHRHILQRGLRLKPLFEPSMSWLAEAGYNLRYGVVIAAIVASVASLLLDLYERVNRSIAVPFPRSPFFKRRNSWVSPSNDTAWEDIRAAKKPRYQEWEGTHDNKTPRYQEWEGTHDNKTPRYQEWEDAHDNKTHIYQKWEVTHNNKTPRYQEWEGAQDNKTPRYQEGEGTHDNKTPRYQDWEYHREIKTSKIGNSVRFNDDDTDRLAESIRVQKRGEREKPRSRQSPYAAASSSDSDSDGYDEHTQKRHEAQPADSYGSSTHSPRASSKKTDEGEGPYRDPFCSKSEFPAHSSLVNDVSVAEVDPVRVNRTVQEDRSPINTARAKHKSRGVRAQSASRVESKRMKNCCGSADKRYVKRSYKSDKSNEGEEMENNERRNTKDVFEDTLNESLLSLRKLRGK